MAKGGGYERELSKRFSLWWTDDRRDDVFWRGQGSGGRATRRGKLGTYGANADMMAMDPIGDPFIQFNVVEAKRGYNRSTPYDIVDLLKGNQTCWEEWIQKSIEARDRNKSYSWMIVNRRDYRKDMVMMPNYASYRLGLNATVDLQLKVRCFRPAGKKRVYDHTKNVAASIFPLDEFLGSVKPETILYVLKRERDDRQ